MYTAHDLDERLVIIKNANLADATILDENYRHLIGESYNYEERQQYLTLQSTVRSRITELQKGV